ncbi:hypothetical protein KBD59_03560 [Candidatus Gracilibacteria bacterium]|nr:hypothetical protein [Candidatus Gracilibacteria bacterium]
MTEQAATITVSSEEIDQLERDGNVVLPNISLFPDAKVGERIKLIAANEGSSLREVIGVIDGITSDGKHSFYRGNPSSEVKVKLAS